MEPRERVLAALHRRMPDRVPKQIRFTPEYRRLLLAKIGTTDYEEYFDLEVRRVGLKPYHGKLDFARYYDDLPQNLCFDDWGLPFLRNTEYHKRLELYPMQSLETVNELKEYPWPDFLADYRHSHLEEETAQLHEEGYAVLGREREVSGGFIFETAWQLRGMTRLFKDCYVNKDFANFLFDKIAEINGALVGRFAEAGVDVIWLGDDVGMQDRPLMSLSFWRKWLKPRLKHLIDSAKESNPDVLIFYHSDGFIEPFIPELIEIGVNILNPIQPECLDPVKIKRIYGERLSFWGTIGVQTTMPHGTPKQVKAAVKRMIETVGQGGGFLIAPCHFIQTDVPWENVIAFFEAVEEYGEY
ncbi:MAG: uroporphyrinogen decarboxylase family protein [Candidatus Bathyarchaeia archaeon]